MTFRKQAFQVAAQCPPEHNPAICTECADKMLSAACEAGVRVSQREFVHGIVIGILIAMAVCFMMLSLMGRG